MITKADAALNAEMARYGYENYTRPDRTEYFRFHGEYPSPAGSILSIEEAKLFLENPHDHNPPIDIPSYDAVTQELQAAIESGYKGVSKIPGVQACDRAETAAGSPPKPNTPDYTRYSGVSPNWSGSQQAAGASGYFGPPEIGGRIVPPDEQVLYTRDFVKRAAQTAAAGGIAVGGALVGLAWVIVSLWRTI